MATDPGGDACPLCGVGCGPARVTLRKRDLPAEAVARVGPGDETAALRESVAWHHSGVAGLQEELEAERGAAAEAASEAMSMILRLQRDKSEAMMEARQFRRFAEDRFAHDAAEVAALQDAIARLDASIHSLSAQLRACRSRLLHLGFLSPSSLPSSPMATATAAAGDHPFADEKYPSIQCLDHPAPSDVGTPRTHHLLNRMPGRPADMRTHPHHARALSNDSLFAYDGGIAVADEFPFMMEQDVSDDDCYRVYTVDAVHGVPVATPEDCCYFPTPVGSDIGFVGGAWADEEQEIKKLSARLQALEADRESMRHAIMSMGADKAQVVMLKDSIAQHLSAQAAPLNALSLEMQPALQPVVVLERKVIRRHTFFAKFFVVTLFKWIASVFSRGKKLDRIKYPFGLCGSYVGLMLLLDRSHKQRNKRHLKRS